MDHALDFIEDLLVEKGGDAEFPKLLDQSEEDINNNLKEMRKE